MVSNLVDKLFWRYGELLYFYTDLYGWNCIEIVKEFV
jgi:hypothetical protein